MLGAFQRYRDGPARPRADDGEIFTLFPRLRERRTQMAGTLGRRTPDAGGRSRADGQSQTADAGRAQPGLAPLITREIFRIVPARQPRVSILLVEQNARAALQVADYAYVLETGGSPWRALPPSSPATAA